MKHALGFLLLISLWVCSGCVKKGALGLASEGVSFRPTIRVTVPIETIPNERSTYSYCRPGSSDYNFAYCFNKMVREKATTIHVRPGVHALVDSLVILQSSRLEVVGIPDANGVFPELLAANASLGRLQHQYFSMLVINSSNITVRNLRFNGNDVGAQRGIAICALPGAVTKNVALAGLALSGYHDFNIMVGESLTKEHWDDIAGYQFDDSHPLLRLAQLVQSEDKRYCIGDIHNVRLTGSEIRMKSVGFYLTPPFGKLSERTAVTADAASMWYSQREALAERFSGMVVSDNRFVAEPLSDTEFNPDLFHSAMKLHNSTRAQITNNLIDLSALKNLGRSRIVVGINVASGMVNSDIRNNVVKYPNHLRSPFAINLQMMVEQHDTYGFGDKKIFGPVKSIRVVGNSIENGVIRFSDCCTNEFRPYCRVINELVRARVLSEKIVLAFNQQNGAPNRDANLVWRTSRNEPLWLKDQSAVYCRNSFDVRVVTGDGEVR